MGKLNRLGWAAGITFVIYGARIGIRVNDPSVLERLPKYLPPGWQLSPSPIVDALYSLIVSRNESGSQMRRFHLLYAGVVRLARTLHGDEVFRTLASDLHVAVALNARRHLFVRAGVVGWRGKAVLILGPHASGRTTLVTALVRAGAALWSDDYAVLDAAGHVHPYVKRLPTPEADGGPANMCPVEVLNDRPARKPLPVGLVVITEYRDGARWRPRFLSPGETVVALLNNTVLARVRPQRALATLGHVASQAASIKGKRGEARDAVLPLLNLVGTGSTPPPVVNQAGFRRDGSVGPLGQRPPTAGQRRKCDVATSPAR
jgi:hypothetical protein